MCQGAIRLISSALHEVANAEALLKIKGVIALFIQTMAVSDFPLMVSTERGGLLIQSWSYQTSALDSFLLILFEKYAELLKKRFSDDFQEVREHFGCFEYTTLTHIVDRVH